MKKEFDRIYIEITNLCNFNCPFCSKCDRDKKEMSILEFEQVLTKISGYTDEVCLHVLGEPLLHKNFEEIICLIEKKNLNVNLVTNGFFIKEKQDIILKHKNVFSKINFSLHAYEFVENCNEKLLNIFLAAKTFSENNILVELRLLDNVGEGFQKVLKETFFQFFAIDLTPKKNLKIQGYLYFVVKKNFEWPTNTSQNTSKTYHKRTKCYCLALKTHIAILSNLDVVPCCLDCNGKVKLGNLKEQSLKEILNTAKVTAMKKEFNDGITEESFCKTCTYGIK